MVTGSGMNKCRRKQILFVDDERKIHKAITQSLAELDVDVVCFCNALDCLKSSEHIKKCDLIITDVNMPGMNGIEFLKNLKQRRPLLPVLVITGYGDIPMAIRAVKAGALEFIEKPLDEHTLLPLVETVLKQTDYHNILVGSPLTECELAVLYRIVQGQSNKQIASELYRSIRTIENHRAHLMRKLNAKNMADLVNRAISFKMIS
jgi:two-component system response regulator FixJ